MSNRYLLKLVGKGPGETQTLRIPKDLAEQLAEWLSKRAASVSRFCGRSSENLVALTMNMHDWGAVQVESEDDGFDLQTATQEELLDKLVEVVNDLSDEQRQKFLGSIQQPPRKDPA